MLPVAVGLTKDSIQEEIPAMSDDGAADRESDTPGAEVDPENETAEPEPGNDVENAAANSAENQSAITTGERPTEQLACARPVQQSDEDYEFLQEQLRDREEELERVRREGQDMAVAEVIAHGNDENDSSTRNKPVSNPKTRWIIALAVVILVVVAILLGVLLPRRSSQTASNPTSSPTMSPTVSPLVSLTAILSDVSPDGGEALSTPSTPQNEALAWLAGNVNLDDYSEEQTIQRFVLATLYYSLNGDGWTNNDGWLSDDEECTWYNQADDGPFCMVGGGVRELDFFQNNLSGTIPAEVGLLSNSLGTCMPLCVMLALVLVSHNLLLNLAI